MRHSYHRFIPRRPLRVSGGSTTSTLLTLGLVGLGGYALYRVLGRGAGMSHYVGGPSDCGQNAYWDEASKTCIPLSIQPPPTSIPPSCPAGMFFDYFKKTCVPGAPAPTQTSGYYGY